MSVMQAMGMNESVSELEINGVKVSVVDKLDGSSVSSGVVETEAGGNLDAGDADDVGATTEVVSTRDGVKVTLMQGTAPRDGGGANGTGGSIQDDGDFGEVIDVAAEEASQEENVAETGRSAPQRVGASRQAGARAAAAASARRSRLGLKRKQGR